VGEVGLGGEVRAVAGLEQRVREAARMGFKRVLMPRPAKGTAPKRVEGVELVVVGDVGEAISELEVQARTKG
jgi:DNA repair protein RadA/Sms